MSQVAPGLARRMRHAAERAGFMLLLVAAATYPFSVAAANAAMGVFLALSLPTGQFATGARKLWRNHRALVVAWLVYLSLLPLGLLWSNDPSWGAHLTARQWFWLAIPPVLACLRNPQRRNLFLLTLSAGLAAHLLFCVGQMLGIVQFVKDGSSANDATGHIGHIGFGFVYGAWAAWLLHQGWQLHGWRRAACWLLALWAVIMVLLAQGRGGYIIAIILPLLIIWRISGGGWKKAGLALTAIATLTTTLIAVGPGRDRVVGAWQGLQAIAKGDFRHADPRWAMWNAAVHVWRKHPFLGTGTGGFRREAERFAKAHPDQWWRHMPTNPAHPHNMYLLALARWGPAGLLALIAVLGLWIRTGWRRNWQASSAGSLIALPAIGLALHGLVAPAFEEHFPGLLAVLLASAGLAKSFSPCPSDAPANASGADA